MTSVKHSKKADPYFISLTSIAEEMASNPPVIIPRNFKLLEEVNAS